MTNQAGQALALNHGKKTPTDMDEERLGKSDERWVVRRVTRYELGSSEKIHERARISNIP